MQRFSTLGQRYRATVPQVFVGDVCVGDLETCLQIEEDGLQPEDHDDEDREDRDAEFGTGGLLAVVRAYGAVDMQEQPQVQHTAAPQDRSQARVQQQRATAMNELDSMARFHEAGMQPGFHEI